MASGQYSFIIEQGATTNIGIDWTDSAGSAINLTNYQARMQIRPTITSDEVIISLSSSLDNDGTGINLNGTDGITPLESGSLAIYISAYSSSLMDFNEAFYDLEMVKEDTVHRLLEGKVKLSKNVTR
jgi:hypothetical protein